MKIPNEIFQICQNEQKKIKSSIIGKIIEIHFYKNDYISLNIEDKNYIYKGLIIIKGEIFPTPKINDLIQIKEINLNFDNSFELKFFIKGKLLFENSKLDFSFNDKTQNKQILDFTELNIISSLKHFFNINNQLDNDLFIISESFQTTENMKIKYNYNIKSLDNKSVYLLENCLNAFQKNEIIFINEFYINENKIEISPFSFIEKLSDENLFLLIQNNIILKTKYFYGKIVDIDEYQKIIYILNYQKKIFIIKNKNYEVKLGQLCLISNYKIENKGDKEYPFINLLEDSFIYFSNQNIYFSEKISLNYSSIIQFYFLDYKDEKNKYNKIEILNIIKDINGDKLDFVFEIDKLKNYEIYPITIKLINDKNNEIIDFEFLLVYGLLNKINTFINNKINKSYFYEYLYYSFDDLPIKSVKEIIINNNKKYIFIYDSFGSSNRIRINILNIPFQNEFEEKIINDENSLLICETFNKIGESKINGIFNISEVHFLIPELFDNEKLDIYYDKFGNLTDYLNQKNIDYNNIIDEFIKKFESLDNYIKENLKKDYYIEKINKSQFKTRISIIISSFLNSVKKSYRRETWKKITSIFNQIDDYKDKINLNQFLRLFTFLINRYKEKKSDYYINFFSELEKDSPYYLAKEFNINEILNINENSKLFLAYLQMDSYILHNYLINKEKSYSLSIEPLFILKNHLKENYEDFFFIEYYNNKKLASYYLSERISVINENNLFNGEDINNINDLKEKKNLAFSISMEFRHEKNSHQKKNIRNRFEFSPVYYYDNGEIKKLINNNENNINVGEDGSLVESFIDNNTNIIKILKEKKIFGELLDYNLFIQKDFNLLKNKMNEIINKEEKLEKENNSDKINKNNIKENIEIQDKNILKENKKEIERLKKLGIINIDDIYYSKEQKKLWMKSCMENKNLSHIPKWVIDKRIKEIEEN